MSQPLFPSGCEHPPAYVKVIHSNRGVDLKWCDLCDSLVEGSVLRHEQSHNNRSPKQTEAPHGR